MTKPSKSKSIDVLSASRWNRSKKCNWAAKKKLNVILLVREHKSWEGLAVKATDRWNPSTYRHLESEFKVDIEVWREKYPDYVIESVSKDHYLDPNTDDGNMLLIPSAGFHYLPLPLLEGFAKLLVH
ncbi:hypothetical protein ACHQM5_021232 [Ranunculus cassubicifolius]